MFHVKQKSPQIRLHPKQKIQQNSGRKDKVYFLNLVEKHRFFHKKLMISEKTELPRGI